MIMKRTEVLKFMRKVNNNEESRIGKQGRITSGSSGTGLMPVPSAC